MEFTFLIVKQNLYKPYQTKKISAYPYEYMKYSKIMISIYSDLFLTFY